LIFNKQYVIDAIKNKLRRVRDKMHINLYN